MLFLPWQISWKNDLDLQTLPPILVTHKSENYHSRSPCQLRNAKTANTLKQVECPIFSRLNQPAMHKTMLLRSFQCPRLIFFMNLSMYSGETARRIWVSQWIMLYRPNPLMKTSHVMTIGANMHPILLVPWCCKVKRQTNMAHAAGVGTSGNFNLRKSECWLNTHS